MYENYKLKEARYFYSRMQAEINNPEHFQYELSAFLSAARSILQYSLKEAQNKSEGQRWYDDYIARNIILGFFKDKRDVNIHAEPIKTKKDYGVTMKATVPISSSLHIKLMDKNGNVIKQQHIQKDVPIKEQNTDDVTIKIKYGFTDWSGSEDIMRLSEMYLNELDKIIEDGIKQGYISG